MTVSHSTRVCSFCVMSLFHWWKKPAKQCPRTRPESSRSGPRDASRPLQWLLDITQAITRMKNSWSTLYPQTGQVPAHWQPVADIPHIMHKHNHEKDSTQMPPTTPGRNPANARPHVWLYTTSWDPGRANAIEEGDCHPCHTPRAILALDLKGAFDNVAHEAIFRNLNNTGSTTQWRI